MFAGLSDDNTNTFLSGSTQGVSDTCFYTAPITCLAGCLTGTVVGDYLRNKRNDKILEGLYGYEESDNEETKKEKRDNFWNQYNIRKKNSNDKNDENNNNNNIIENDNNIDIKDDKEDNSLSREERKRFIENPDVYGTGITGWFNFLCCKGPQYVIEKRIDKLEVKVEGELEKQSESFKNELENSKNDDEIQTKAKFKELKVLSSNDNFTIQAIKPEPKLKTLKINKTNVVNIQAQPKSKSVLEVSKDNNNLEIKAEAKPELAISENNNEITFQAIKPEPKLKMSENDEEIINPVIEPKLALGELGFKDPHTLEGHEWNDEHEKKWRSHYRLDKDVIIAWINGLKKEDKGDVILKIINQGQNNWDLIFAKIANDGKLIESLFSYLQNNWPSKQDKIPDAVFNFFIGILDKLSEEQLLELFAKNDNYVLNMLLNILQKGEDREHVPALKRKLFNFFIKHYDELNVGEKYEEGNDNLINNKNDNNEIKIGKIKLFFNLMNECAPVLTEKDLNTNIQKIQLLFEKIEDTYDKLESENKAIIVKFAIDILNKIDKKDKNAYKNMLNFIIQKLNNDKDILDAVFNNNGLKIKVFKFVIDNYDIKDLLQTYKNNNNKLPQNLQTFVIEFFKQYDINIAENSDDNTLMLQLLKALLEKFNDGKLKDDKNGELNDSIIGLILGIVKQQKDDDKIYKLLSENWELIFAKIANDGELIESLFSYLQKNWLSKQDKIPDAVFNFFIGILDRYNGDKGKLKMMFEKIVNEDNIEVFIKIMLEDDKLKQKILDNDSLKKLFLQQIIKQPDVIIQQLLHVDDYEEEINEDSKNNVNNKNNNKNKKQKRQEFLKFFLSLWETAIKEKILTTANIGDFLIKILTHVKNNMQEQAQLDILWKILKDPILNIDDKKNMPESFWVLLHDIVLQMKTYSQRVPQYVRDAMDAWIEKNKTALKDVNKKSKKTTKLVANKAEKRLHAQEFLKKPRCDKYFPVLDDKSYGGARGPGPQTNQTSIGNQFYIDKNNIDKNNFNHQMNVLFEGSGNKPNIMLFNDDKGIRINPGVNINKKYNNLKNNKNNVCYETSYDSSFKNMFNDGLKYNKEKHYKNTTDITKNK